MSRAKKQRATERRHLREGKGKPGAWTPDTPPRRDGEIEVVAGEIVAYRGWWVWDDPELGAVLYSMYALVPWEGPTLVADGEPRPHKGSYVVPGPRPVGIHALKLPEWLASTYRSSCHVEGEVALSGKVVVGQNGFQAERATIQRLTVRHGHVTLAQDTGRQDWRGCDAVRERPTPPDGQWSTSISFSMAWGTRAESWPDTLSMYRAAEELAARYQCEVEIGEPLGQPRP